MYFGDNLEVLRRHIKDESVDLIYLDPPFKSDQDYNVLFAEPGGVKATAQIKAFEDTWTWDEDAARNYQEVVERGGPVADAMLAFRTLLGDNDLLAYLSMMAPRLVELHRVLRPTGSIYLHCDPTASHYLKILMDAVFGKRNFRNEVIWWYRKWSKSTTRFLRNHDVLLFYAKSGRSTFNVLRVPLAPSTLRRFGGKRQDYADEARTRKITTDEPSEGGFRPDVWSVNAIPAQSAERLGYPTQKPEALLELVIQASSNPGDVVLDPFCGCGTAIAVAQRMDRAWIGIDITHLAIGLVRRRLIDAFGDDVTASFEVVGEPTDLAGAKELARSDPYQFQFWILGLVGARPAEQKKGADRGIDGRIFFHEPVTGSKTKQIVLSVKAGKLHAPYVRDLRGVMEREKAEFGVLLCMEKPTSKMRAEAASAGFYTPEVIGGSFPRLQIITVEDLLEGRGIQYPGRGTGPTFRRARRAQRVGSEQLRLGAAETEGVYGVGDE